MKRRRWLYGNKKAGYSLLHLKRKKNPWRTQVWFEGKIVRTDVFATEAEAVKYAKQRMQTFYGKLKKR